MKKKAALLSTLALVIALLMPSTALAAQTTPEKQVWDRSRTGSITVQKYTEDSYLTDQPTTNTGSSGSQTGGSTTGGGNSTANTPAAKPEPEPPKHEHSWEPVYTTVHHDEVGHYETVTVQEAYDEQIKDYRAVCSVCGAYFETGDAALNHVDDEHGGHGSYSGKKAVSQPQQRIALPLIL